MPVEPLGNGGFVATGDSIRLYQLLALRGALKLEIAGMRRNGRPASVIVRELLGSRTRNKAALLEEFERYLR